MIDLDYAFGKNAWETFLDTKKTGERVSAVRLLTLLEGEPEASTEEALDDVDARGLILEIHELPKFSGNGAAALRLRQEEQLARKGLPVAEMEENDPLRLYLEEISFAENSGDEEELAAKYVAGDQFAAEKLTNLGIKRVVALVEEYVGYGVLLLDLIQEGSLGLWQAIQNYKSGEYKTYRDRRIRNAMAKAVAIQARSSGVSQKMRMAMEDYRQVDERLLGELGRNPTIDEIAEQMHISAEEAETVKKMLADAQLIQRAQNDQEPDEQEEQDAEHAVEDTAYFQARQRILELLSTLDEADAKLLTLRFGLEKGKPLSPEETGRILGLTPDEVIAREAQALALLRNQD